MASTSNFDFLKEHDPLFFQLASAAERTFTSDPNTTLIKLRQLGEALAQDLAARCGIEFDDKTTQADLLFKLNREIRLDADVAELFHTLRIEGNRANHQFRTLHKEALDVLLIARALAIWFHQAFGKQGTNFKPGPFLAPTDPSLELRELTIQIDQLKAKLQDANEQVETNQQLIELTAREKEQHAVLAKQMGVEARIFEQMAQEHEQQLRQERQAFEARLQTMQAELETKTQTNQYVSATIKMATAELSINEELSRILIDQQLIAAGWEADTEELTYQKGARPEKGKNKAISEWPTKGKQSADYMLFAGLTPIAVVEAKRENTNVAGKIPQAKRYSRGFAVTCIPWLSGTTGRAKLTQAALNSLPMGLPPEKEQTEIVRRLEQLFAYPDQIEQRVKDAQARVNHLTQPILAKAFRGHLTADWREQNHNLISGENSAQVLLAKIKADRQCCYKKA